MRNYAKLSPTFWTGETGKSLRKRGSEAVLVALYLVSSPHSNMLGLYYQPVMYIAHETGLGPEAAMKGLQECIACGFCSYDERTEMVWVHEMAAWQIAEALAPEDKRCKGIQKDYDALPANPYLAPFFDRYVGAFHMTERRGSQGASHAPSKAQASQEQEQEQSRSTKLPSGAVATAARRATRKPTTPQASCPYHSIVELYHQALPTLPRVKLMGDARQRALRKVWAWVLTSTKTDGERRAETADEALEWFRGYFKRASENGFVVGRTPPGAGHETWVCDLDFLLTEKGMRIVIEKTQEPAA